MAGSYPVHVQVASVGVSNENLNFTYSQMVNSLSPMQGSISGGLYLSINGKGFGQNTQVKICGVYCAPIVDYNYSSLTCIVS